MCYILASTSYDDLSLFNEHVLVMNLPLSTDNAYDSLDTFELVDFFDIFQEMDMDNPPVFGVKDVPMALLDHSLKLSYT